MKSNKTVFLVLNQPFWLVGLGCNLKMGQLARYLAENFHLVMVCIGTSPTAEQMRAAIGREVDCIHAPNLNENIFAALRAAVVDAAPFAAIIEYVHLWLLKGIFDRSTTVLIDTHDLMHLRREEFEKFGRTWGSLDAKTEWAILSSFDGVIFVQEEEYAEGLKQLPAEKCLLSPPALELSPVPWCRDPVVGFLGSAAAPNIDGLEWLHDVVYGGKPPKGHEVHIYGTVGQSHTVRHKCRNFQFKGPVAAVAEMFSKVRLSVNPSRFGSGIKIKTMESLSHGVPHITTSIGVQGFPDRDGGWCLIRDEPEAFRAAIEELLGSDEACLQLRQRGLDMVAKNFSLERCLAPIADLLEQKAAAAA